MVRGLLKLGQILPRRVIRHSPLQVLTLFVDMNRLLARFIVVDGGLRLRIWHDYFPLDFRIL